MKLQCQVDVVNRLHNSLSIRTNGKYLKSTIALGKEVKSETDYFILHFSSVNKTGTRYKLKNIKQVFVKCINEGKATIRFAEPPHDLLIKSEALQLKCFMKMLSCCVNGDTKNIDIKTLSNISVVARDNAPSKLVIRNRCDFPSNGLPRTLETLYINGLKLCNFRRDILLLRHLVVLDLSNNEIEKIPYEFGRMPCLYELYLSNNKLGIKGDIDWSWLLGPQITKSLKLIDLSGNHLTYICKGIWKLEKLVTLKLDNNMIRHLPSTLGRIGSLRYLTVSQNQLSSLPCSLIKLNLDYFDLSSNMFYASTETNAPIRRHSLWDMCVGSLVNISSKTVLKHRLFYAANIIPWTLVEFLDNANMCLCGAPVVNNMYDTTHEIQIKYCYKVVVFDNNNRGGTVRFDCTFCSWKCYNDTCHV